MELDSVEDGDDADELGDDEEDEGGDVELAAGPGPLPLVPPLLQGRRGLGK